MPLTVHRRGARLPDSAAREPSKRKTPEGEALTPQRQGWGQRVGPSNEKLMASSDSRRAMMARVGRQFPGTTLSSHPPMPSVFAKDPTGKKAPIKLTVEGSTLRLEQGTKSVTQQVPARASAAQLDAAVETLARALKRSES